MRDYVLLKEIGKGTFGHAVLASKRSDNQKVVIKRVDTAKLTARQQSDVINEVNVLKQLRHPFIVRYYDSFAEKSIVSIVMEFADNGDLYRLISTHRLMQKPFSEGQILSWFTQLTLALSYLHETKIMHRDLKPANVGIVFEDERFDDE